MADTPCQPVASQRLGIGNYAQFLLPIFTGHLSLLNLGSINVRCDNDPPLGSIIGIAYDGQGVLPTEGIHKAPRTESTRITEKDCGVERYPREWRGGYIFGTLI